MSLKSFHIFFIAVCSLSCLGFGLFFLKSEATQDQPVYTWMGIGSIIISVLLVIYGKKFLDKMKKAGIE